MHKGLLDIVKAYIAYICIHNEILKYLKNKSQFSKTYAISGFSGTKLPQIYSNITGIKNCVEQ